MTNEFKNMRTLRKEGVQLSVDMNKMKRNLDYRLSSNAPLAWRC